MAIMIASAARIPRKRKAPDINDLRSNGDELPI
jgi:hypothetical protein